MFGRATITLGIGPHSSYIFSSVNCCLFFFGEIKINIVFTFDDTGHLLVSYCAVML